MGWLQLRRWLSFLPAAFFVYILLHYLIYQPVIQDGQANFLAGYRRSSNLSTNGAPKSPPVSLDPGGDPNGAILVTGRANFAPPVVDRSKETARFNAKQSFVSDDETYDEPQIPPKKIFSSVEGTEEEDKRKSRNKKGLSPSIIDGRTLASLRSGLLAPTEIKQQENYAYDEPPNISETRDAIEGREEKGINVKVVKNNRIENGRSASGSVTSEEMQQSSSENGGMLPPSSGASKVEPNVNLFAHSKAMSELGALSLNLKRDLPQIPSYNDVFDHNYFNDQQNIDNYQYLVFDANKRVLQPKDKPVNSYSKSTSENRQRLVEENIPNDVYEENGVDPSNSLVPDAHGNSDRVNAQIFGDAPNQMLRESNNKADTRNYVHPQDEYGEHSIIVPRELLSEKDKESNVGKDDSASRDRKTINNSLEKSRISIKEPRAAPEPFLILPKGGALGGDEEGEPVDHTEPRVSSPFKGGEDPSSAEKRAPEQTGDPKQRQKTQPQAPPKDPPQQQQQQQQQPVEQAQPPQSPQSKHTQVVKSQGTSVQAKLSSVKRPATAPPTAGFSINSLKGKITIGEKHEKGFTTPHEELCPNNGRDLKVLILITTAPDHEKHRNAVRQTWGHFAMRKDVSLGFMVGRTSRADVQAVIDKENDRYGDIIEANFVDHYSNLTLKTVSMFEWAKTYCSEARFVLKTDDDMFINVPLLLAFIKAKNNERHAMFGRLAKGWKPVRNKKSKYYIDTATYSRVRYPDFLTGPAYLFTNDVVEEVYNKALNTTFFMLEDVLLTGFVGESLRVKRVGDSHFRNEKIKLTDTCKLMQSISIHMVKYEEQFDIYKRTLDGKTKCKTR